MSNRPLEIENLKAIQKRRAPQLAQKERELEVWRQAYNAALCGISTNNTDSADIYAWSLANQALKDYRTKREDLME